MKDFVKALIAEISFLDLSSHLQQFYSLFRHRERTLRERDKSLRQVPLLGQFLNVYFYFYTISSSCCNFNILEDGTVLKLWSGTIYTRYWCAWNICLCSLQLLLWNPNTFLFPRHHIVMLVRKPWVSNFKALGNPVA